MSQSHVRVHGIGSCLNTAFPKAPASFAEQPRDVESPLPRLLQGAEPVPGVPSKGRWDKRDWLLWGPGGTAVTLGVGPQCGGGGVQLPSPGPQEAEIASAFNYSLSAYQMLVHLLHMNAD